MVNLDKAGGSGNEIPSSNTSCSVGASLEESKDGYCTDSAKEIQLVNGKMSVKESHLFNANCSDKESVNGISTVNGHCDKRPAKEIPTVNGHSKIKNILTVNGNSGDNLIEKQMTDGIAPSVNGSSNLLGSDPLCNGDNTDENLPGFSIVENKKRSKNKNRNNRKKQNHLPAGQNTTSVRRDNKSDKNHGEKTPPLHLSQKPSRSHSYVDTNKSYSCALTNGHVTDSKVRSVPDISTDKSSMKLTSDKTHNSDDRLPAELTKTAFIRNPSATPCKNSYFSPKIAMTVSGQIGATSHIDDSPSQKELYSYEVNGSEKSSTPSDYVDVGEISDESSNGAYCDSVVSNDSGRGDTEITYDAARPYYCEFPKEKTSQLIGRGGSFRKEIQERSGCEFWVYPHESDSSLSIISMTGTGLQIERAKELIKERFRHVTLKQWPNNEEVFQPINPELAPILLPQLPEGVDTMVEVSFIKNPAEFWVQQYAHPDFHSLVSLETSMTNHFNYATDVPAVENPTLGSVVAVPDYPEEGQLNGWRRGVITSIEKENAFKVEYLDHGGEAVIPISDIRPMRENFFTIRFFATKCCLNDIYPTGGKWSEEAIKEFGRLCTQAKKPPIVRVNGYATEYYFITLFVYDSDIERYTDMAGHLIAKGFGVRPSLAAVQFYY